MKIITADFETFYSKEYSLRRMTPVEYILDPRFEATLCAFKPLGGKPFIVEGPDLPKYFASLDPNVTAMVTFNALFDASIMGWRYNFVPRLMIDAMGIARACRGHELSRFNLKTVAAHLGIGVKGETILKVEGMGAEAIKQAGLWDEYAGYAMDDATLAEGIFEKLVLGGEFPKSELAVMDLVLKCAVKPRFKIDTTVLAEYLSEIRAKKQHLLSQALLVGDTSGKDDLMSNERFAECLRSVGCEPPMKVSLRTGKPTYAFSKTDPEFLELEEHENPAVQILVAARLGHKSTIAETRCERLLKIASLDWPGQGQVGWMPIPLRFSGAHTHRLSGDWKLNMQNNPKKGGLRKSLVAGPGEVVFAIDASQIEARMAAYFCGQQDLVDAFANGDDVYSIFATDVFDKPINKKDNPNERFVGKTGILGLQYGMGAPKFQKTVKVQSINQTGVAIEISDDEAMLTVSTYRRKYSKIKAAWRELENLFRALTGEAAPQWWGPCWFEKGSILLPSGLRLFYRDLTLENGQWRFKYGAKTKFLWGGTLLENIIQALARIVVMDAAVRAQKRLADQGVWINLQAHDELVAVIPEKSLDSVRTIFLEEMTRRPTWAPGLPLAAECDYGHSYGDAK